MRTYQDTDIEISNLVSCNVCGNWYWSKLRSMFICDGCKELHYQQMSEYQRKKNGERYQLAPESIERGQRIFDILIEHKDTGLTAWELKKEVIKRGVGTKNIYDCNMTLARSGYLTWMDDDGRLYPYMNVNTGERYE
jgi:hypothetical protein